MLQFGKYNTLQVSRKTDNGFYLCETGGEGEQGKDDHIDHQRRFAPEAVRDASEDHRPEDPQSQGHGQRPGDRLDGDPELRGDFRHDEDQDEEVERVERPAQKAGRHDVPLARSFGHGVPAPQRKGSPAFLRTVAPSFVQAKEKVTRWLRLVCALRREAIGAI